MNTQVRHCPSRARLSIFGTLAMFAVLILGGWAGGIGMAIGVEARIASSIPSYPVDAFLHGLQWGDHDFEQKTFVARNLSRSLPSDIVDEIVAETENYYDIIDPDGLRRTLNCFKSVNGFTALPCVVAQQQAGDDPLPNLDVGDLNALSRVNPQTLPAPMRSAQRSVSSSTLTSDASAHWSDVTDVPIAVYTNEPINARYANSADLGFGRDMHCLRRDSLHVACYVTNYFPIDALGELIFDSPDQEDADAAALQDSSQLVATVAMEYSPIAENGNEPVVKFYVYDENGNRIGAADLDGLGARPVPQLCMMCHGGNLKGDVDAYGIARFRTENDVKLDSKFLPFDLATFTYPTIPGYSKADQQHAFKLLNKEIVLSTQPGKAIEEVIEQMYAQNSLVQIEDFVVPGWDTDDTSRDFYRNVIAKSCRSCHIASTLKTAANTGYPLRFRKKSDVVDRLGSIQALVCSSYVMPHSLVTYRNFWKSGQNRQLDSFGNAFGSATNGWIANLCDNPNAPTIENTLEALDLSAAQTVSATRAATSVNPFTATQQTPTIDRRFVDLIEPMLQSKCAWCHYPNNPDRPVPPDLRLQRGHVYDAISGYVTPYQGEASVLYGYVSGESPYMPKHCVGKYCLTNPELNDLLDWIDSGALRGTVTVFP